MPAVRLDRERAGRMRQGQPVAADAVGADTPQAGLVRLYGPGERFLGIGAVEDAGHRLKPVRLFNDSGHIHT
jgi:tRNA pseudouridine55 synthase